MITTDLIKSEYPLHWLIWNNNYQELSKELSNNCVSVHIYNV